MNENLSQPIPEEIYYAAKQYLPCLSDELQAQVRTLLDQAQAGQKSDNAILSLLSQEEKARKWMRLALFGGGNVVSFKGAYSPLAGLPTSVPANSRWICPQCGYEWHVLRVGRPVPPCPHDKSVLVLAK